MSDKITRRTFLTTGLASIAGLEVALHGGELNDAFLRVKPDVMPTRPLGRTGYTVPLFSLGGQSTLEESGMEDEADAIINRALDLGVNYIDTAALYGRGQSETYIGRVMKSRRKEVYLATKTHDRSYDGAMRHLERSLENLQTDHIDCWQVHNVRMSRDLDEMFADDGVMKAMMKAKEEKVTRFIGITGHRDPHVLAEGLKRFDFDTILMALNAADRHHNSFIEHLLPVAVEKKLGVIGMKIPARGRIFEAGLTMEQAMRYVLTLPVSTVIIGIDSIKQLEENIRIACDFTPMSAKEMKELEEKTEPSHREVAWFKYSW